MRLASIFRNYFELTFRRHIALEFCKFEEHYSIKIAPVFFSLFVKMPFLKVENPPKGGMMESWGGAYSFEERIIHLSWGSKYKIFDVPWAWKLVRHTVWDSDGKAYNKKSKELDNMYGEELLNFLVAPEYDYRYVLKSGEVQNRKIRIYVEELEWRWKWLAFLKFPRRISKDIDVTFNKETGEEAGTYKGGVMECTYKMLPNESPLGASIRMENTRKF